MSKKLFLLVAILSLASFMVFAETLTVFYLNDTHGHAWAYSRWHNPNIGGFAYVDSVLEYQRALAILKGQDVLFLHAGDINTGVPESDLLDAVPDIVALNMMGLDAMTVGNHEFDHSNSVLQMQEKLADFPFLSANIYDKDGQRVFKPYIIKNFNGFKVAIVGFTTEECAIITNPQNTGNLQFRNVVAEAKKVVKELKDQGINFIIALTHLGVVDAGYPTTSIELARRVPGIGLIVDGHSHTLLNPPLKVNDAYIVQAKSWDQYLGKITLDIEDGKVVKADNELIPINLKKYDKTTKTYSYVGQKILPDPKVAAVLAYFKSLGSKKLDQVLGTTSILLDGEEKNVRSKDTNLAHLITDAMRTKVNGDITLQNGGGIRASILPGNITYRNILTVLPFGNTLYVIDLTGKQIMDVLKYAATVPNGKGAHLQTSGLTWVNDNGKPANVMINGKPIDLNATYKVVTNNYMAAGGDGYSMLKEGKNGYDTGYVLADVVKEYIQKLGKITSYDDTPRYVVKK